MAVFTRVYFSREEEYYDDNVSPYYTFNYTTLSKSIYSGFLTAFEEAGTGDGFERFYENDKLTCLFWVCVTLFIRFLLCNFLIGNLGAYYGALTEQEKEFINTHPE